MDNKMTSLPLKHIQEVKTYSLVYFKITDHIASGQVYLVDKKNHRILMYRMNRGSVDETKKALRRFESNKNKPFLQQKIGGELYKLMENHDEPLYYLKVLSHSDSALEITEKLYEIRALQAEFYLRICRNHCHWATDEAAVEHFAEI